MRRHIIGASLLALGLAGGGAARAEPLTIVFTHHSSAANPFWQAVKKGFDDACAKIQASCQMTFLQNEGAIEQQVANMQAALARHPDALVTALADNHAFIGVLTQARKQGTIVIASNVDATEGPELKLREAFIGQNFIPAGENLARTLSRQFPRTGDLRILVGISAPGQNWAEQRAQGVMNGLEEYRKANPGQKIVIDKIDSGTDAAITADRVGAYITAHPDTTAYFDMGLWHSGVARMLKDRGIPPSKILMGGFDLVTQVLQEMKAGYIQVEVDQQPYEQGFMPVMEVYLARKFGLAPANIDTGEAIVTPEMVDMIMPLARQGLR
jgi:simple sugar transport system substrate-binding protein